MPLELMIVAGEASGDAHAAELITALRRRHPGLHCFGCGGERMAAAGCELLVSVSQLAVMGLAEVVTHLPRLHRLWRELRQALRRRRPAGIVLVDFPDFNLRLAAAAHAAGIPVVYFISPQLWAWRSGRVKQIRRTVRRMICIFPFEPGFYARQGVEVAGVGHPLVDRIAQARRELPSVADFRAGIGAGSGATLIALLPGSRRRELDYHLPTMLEAAARLRAEPGSGPPCEFVLPVAPTLTAAAVAAIIPERLRPAIHLVASTQMYAALTHSRLAIVASGTATVETAMLGTPMIVVYRLSAWSYWLGRNLVRTPHVAMVNLIADKPVVPELIQSAFRVENVLNWVHRLLPESEQRLQMQQDLALVSQRLGPPGAIERAAEEVERTLRLQPTPARKA
ncbi:MAG: lipid-A-disaccharide synthase [Terriglobales bacterium]